MGNLLSKDKDSIHSGGVFKIIYDYNLNNIISWGYN
jgi:hypothetical protein